MKSSVQPVAERLAAGLPRGLGPATRLAEEAQNSAPVLRELIAALHDERSVVTHRAANALRTLQKARPELLAPYSGALLQAANECSDLRTRWNLTIIVGELPLRGRDKALGMDLMFAALRSESSFLRAFALTGLMNFAEDDGALRRRVQPILDKALEDASAAVRARARVLRKRLDQTPPAQDRTERGPSY